LKQTRLITLFFLALAAQIHGGALENDGFRLRATMIHLFRDAAGTLYIGPEAISFRSDDGKTKLDLPLLEVREADVSDARKLRFSLYDVRKWEPLARREFVFRAPPDTPVEDIARMLSASMRRPVVGHYAGVSNFSVAAFHKRTLKGTSGTLEIGADAIRYVSQQADDSRTWRYRDIQTIGSPDPYRFRVTTTRETYILELKDQLPDGAFQMAWERVYSMEPGVK
jgi:hypothetical protein